MMQEVRRKEKSISIDAKNFPTQIIKPLEKHAVGGFSVHKNPFDINKSTAELQSMIAEAQPVPKSKDPTIKKSNFKTSDAKYTVGHNNKPLGDWDVLALEDVNRFQIEEKNKKILHKR